MVKGEILGSAVVLAIGLATYGYLTTPRHVMTRLDQWTVFKLDRLNGDIMRCQIFDDGDNYCVQLPEFAEVDPKLPNERGTSEMTTDSAD